MSFPKKLKSSLWDFPDRIERAIDEFEERDAAQWTNVKALQGPQWKGRFRKRVARTASFSKSTRSVERWKSQLSSSNPKTLIGDARTVYLYEQHACDQPTSAIVKGAIYL